MKLLVAIIRDEFASETTAALTEAGLSVTRISTTGGFWRRGNATLLIGVEEEEINRALAVIDQHAGPPIAPSESQSTRPPHRATIFVLDVDSVARY